jgi:hypothetical protein
VVSLELRVSRLEERRADEAAAEIMSRARNAPLDALARFLLSPFELDAQRVEREEIERIAWRHLDVPLELVHQAAGRPEWAAALSDLLVARRGLLSHMRERYPELTRKFLAANKEEIERLTNNGP